jgi:hypothetical protein
MTFEEYKKQQGTEFPYYVIDPSDGWSTHEITWNEARRTDPVKKQMLDALKELQYYIDPVDEDVMRIVNKAIARAEEE